MSTPTSTGPLDADLDHFVARLRQRLERGARQYGNASFARPVAELIGEAIEEAEDIVGWSFLAWTRLQRLRDAIARVDATEANHG